MSASQLPSRPLPSLHQQIPMDDEEINRIKERLLEILRPASWKHETPNAPSASTCLDMAMDTMMYNISAFDRVFSLQRDYGRRAHGGFISAIGVPDFEEEQQRDQIIAFFREYLEVNIEKSPLDHQRLSREFGFRLASMYEVGREIPIALGRHWLSLGEEDLKLLLCFTQKYCTPVLSWKRTDKEEGTAVENIKEGFLSVQRMNDLLKRVE
ncbi:hypothetical protein P7C71_g4725, partial [Lecanoromycetidae sp. Uapishka_2]